MKPKLYVFLLLSLFISIYSCKKKDSDLINPQPPTSDIISAENNRLSGAVTNQTTTAFISGTVTDEEGKVLPGVTVRAGNATVTTNEKGYFQFPESVTVNKDYAIITATLSGYFRVIRTFTPNPVGKANHYFAIKLLKPGADKTVSSNGGNVVLDNKINLTFPDAAVVTSTGAVYNGQYKVIARYIDPAAANFLDFMPGLLTGLNDQNQLQALLSFGMVMVELKDVSGNSLQIAPGKTVTLKLPAPADGPASIPLWHFNETYGMWIKAGIATKTGNTYTAEVNHFSTWNLGLESNSFRLDLQFKDLMGNALSGLLTEIYIDGETKIESFYTDNEGKATLINCPSSKTIILRTFFQCDTIMKTLDPVTESRSEVMIVSYGSGLKSYTVRGTLTGCDHTTLANQPFKITLQGDGSSIGLPGVTDAQGNYTLSGLICNNSNTISVQAMAFIAGDYKYAPAVTATTTNSIYNAQICDTSLSIPDNFQILFPDPILDSLIRAKINKPTGTIYYSNVKTIDTLVAFATISDLAGIQFCTNLKVLDLRGGVSFSDLGILKNLLSLQGLFISEVGNGLVSDISPLQNLTQLQDLSLTCPILSDISPIRNLVHLRSLSLKGGSVSDISALRNLTNTNWLYLNSDALSDLSPLQNLTQLKNLGIESKLLTRSSLNVLQNFKSLIDLTISRTSISDFSIVRSLPQLRYLHLDGNQVADVSQFASSTNLISLELSQNKIADISALQTMTQLQYLKLSYNQITDIASLKNLSSAILIDLDHNLITNVTSLQNLNNLQMLWLGNNQISNISPLTVGVPNLQILRIVYQQQGKITQAQQDAFTSYHPACFVEW